MGKERKGHIKGFGLSSEKSGAGVGEAHCRLLNRGCHYDIVTLTASLWLPVGVKGRSREAITSSAEMMKAKDGGWKEKQMGK